MIETGIQEQELLALTLKEMDGPTTIMGTESHNAYYDAKDFRRSFENMISKIPDVEPRTPAACRNTFVANQFATGKKATEIAQMLGIKDTRGIAKFRPKRSRRETAPKKPQAKPNKGGLIPFTQDVYRGLLRSFSPFL